MIELFKTTRASMKFDRMIPSGSSWLIGIKVQRLAGQGHTVIEPGEKSSMWKLHQITGHTGEHLLRPTAKYMKIEMTGQLSPCEICAQAKIRQANISKKKQKQVSSRPRCRMFMDINSFKHESMGGKRHWLIVVDRFSDCSHSFFLKRKSDQTVVMPIWIKGLNNKFGIIVKEIRLDNCGENCRILGLQPLIPLLQYVNRLGFEICSVNRTRKLGYVNLNWPRCSAWVTESLVLTDGSFCRKQNTLYFRLCKNWDVYDVYFDCGSSIQSYASLVFLGMHASRKVQSWQKVSHHLE